MAKEYYLEQSGVKINYTIIKGKYKHIYIQIKNGNVIIKAPNSVSISNIQSCIEQKKEWIFEKLNSKNSNIPKPKECVNGETLYLLGEKLELKFEYAPVKSIAMYIENGFLIITLPLSFQNQINEKQLQIVKAIENFFKRKAEEFILTESTKLYDITKLKPKSISIKKMKSSWGRCSSKGTISYNYKLIAYPENSVRYVILHEICHLKHLNHSKQFWALVASYMPEYKKHQNVLKDQKYSFLNK